MLLGITCLFITVTAIQFWMTDYMIQVHDIDQNTAFKIFAAVALLVPAGGVLSGGIIFDRYGGYNSYKSLHVLQLVGFAACFTGMIAGLSQSFIGFCIFMIA